ncbi:hypothetical protein ABZY03_12375 [Streptomyces klenkii]|uniref:hypothetical protein n=1 Tax=Streptomyces klenkii TaxID=1420899 RepID=UPI0033A38B0A
MTTNDGPPAGGPGATVAHTREPRRLPGGEGLNKAVTKLAATVIFIALIHGSRMEPRAAGLLTLEIVAGTCLIHSAGPAMRNGGTKVKQLLSAITS